ncbi:MAG: hypothetical protein SGPRY_011209 [Prymnesium sp.]
MEIGLLEGTLPPTPETIHTASCGPALFNPCGITCSLTGTVYIADTGHHRICKLHAGVLTVLAGSGARGYADGAGLDAMFSHPCGLATDTEGNIFVADCGNQRIRQISPEGVVITIAGGRCSGVASYRDGPGRHASFYNPCSIAIDYVSNETLYVADYSNNCVRVVSRGGVVSTLASDHSVPIDSPYGIAVFMEPTHAGTHEPRVFISSYHSHSLAEVLPDGVAELVAGCGAARRVDGPRQLAAFHAPNGLAVDSEGILYVADSGNHCVRSVSADGYVSTVAGDGLPGISEQHFNSPCGVCVGYLPGLGSVLLVADRANSCVRVVQTTALPPPRLFPSTIRKDLSTLLDGDAHHFGSSEAIFEIEGRTLRAPKPVLCARCPHFRAMFTSGMRECHDDTVKIPDVSYTAYRALLSYLLADELSSDLSVAEMVELMMLANAYDVKRLEQLSAHAIAPLLDKRNAAEVLSCAESIGQSYLVRAAMKITPHPERRRKGV